MKKFLTLSIVLFCCFCLTGCHITTNLTHSLMPLVHANFVQDRGPNTTRIYREREFNRINVNCIDNDIEFKNGKNYQVIFKGYENLKPTVSLKNGLLNIQDNKVVHRSYQRAKIIIETPKKYFYSAKIYSSNGDITGSTIKTNKGSLISNNGDIELDDLYLKDKVAVTSDNGDINVDYCNAKGYHLQTDNGDVSFEGDDHDNNFEKNISTKSLLRAYSDNGDISVN